MDMQQLNPARPNLRRSRQIHICMEQAHTIPRPDGLQSVGWQAALYCAAPVGKHQPRQVVDRDDIAFIDICLLLLVPGDVHACTLAPAPSALHQQPARNPGVSGAPHVDVKSCTLGPQCAIHSVKACQRYLPSGSRVPTKSASFILVGTTRPYLQCERQR